MAIEPIIVRFAAGGIPEVQAAFATVAKQAQRFEDQATRASERGKRERVGIATAEEKDREKAYAKLAKEVQREEEKRTAQVEKESAKRTAAEAKAAKKIRDDETKAAKAAAREVERLEEYKMRVRIRSSEMAGRAAAREVAEEMKAREKLAATAGRGVQRLGGQLGGAARIAAGAVGIGAGFMIANAARREMSDERTAALLVNQVTTGATPPSGANVKNILSQAGAISKETGLDRGDLVQASLTYAQNARRGDFAGAMGNMGFIAKLSKVTGTSMTDLAEAAGTLQSQNADLGPAQMQQLLLNAYAQSKQGSMSLTDAAKQIGILGSTRSSFAGNVTENQRALIGFGQIARAGGDVGEAGTFVKDIALEMSKANAKFKKHSGRDLVKVDEHGRFESPESMVLDVFRNTKGNIQTINDLMGVRGGAMFRELEGSYIQGAGKKNDVEAGIRAVQANMREVTGATMTSGDLESQFKQSMSQPAERLAVSMNKVEEELKERFSPALEELAKKLSDPKVADSIDSVISAMGKIASYLVENPWSGLGHLIAAKIAMDLAQAGIGAAVKKVLLALMGGGGGGGAGVPGFGAGKGFLGGMGVLGNVAAGVGIAAASTGVTIAGMEAIDAYNAAARGAAGRETLRGAQASADAGALHRAARTKTVTASDIAAMQERVEAQRKLVQEKQVAVQSGPGVVANVLGVGGEVAADQRAQYNLQKQALDEMVKSIKEATDALRAMKTGTPDKIPPVTSGAPGGPIPTRHVM